MMIIMISTMMNSAKTMSLDRIDDIKCFLSPEGTSEPF